MFSRNCRSKNRKCRSALPTDLRISQFVVYCGHGYQGIRGPEGKSVPRTPRWPKTALRLLKTIQGGPKTGIIFVHLIISRNISRFSQFFHCQNQETICNQTVIIYPTTHQVCRYTSLWNIRRRTQAGNATDQLRDQRWSSLACGSQTARI